MRGIEGMQVRLEGGPFGGHEGPVDQAWLPSWVRVREGGDGPNGLLLSPGGHGGGELYVLAFEGEVCVFNHWAVGAGRQAGVLGEWADA